MRERWPLSIVGEGLRPARLAPPQVWAELPLKRCHAQAVRAAILVCTENLDSDVLMMQPADQGMRHNASDPLNWARDRRILSQGAMSSRRVVIARIGFRRSLLVN